MASENNKEDANICTDKVGENGTGARQAITLSQIARGQNLFTSLCYSVATFETVCRVSPTHARRHRLLQHEFSLMRKTKFKSPRVRDTNATSSPQDVQEIQQCLRNNTPTTNPNRNEPPTLQPRVSWDTKLRNRKFRKLQL